MGLLVGARQYNLYPRAGGKGTRPLLIVYAPDLPRTCASVMQKEHDPCLERLE